MIDDDSPFAVWAERLRAAQGEPPLPEPPRPPPKRARPGRGRPREVRARTLGRKYLATTAARGENLIDETLEYDRPSTRADCLSMERPCPFVSCRYHIFLDAGRDGAVKLNFPDLEVWELTESCSLDVAERDGIPGSGQGPGATLGQVGAILNVTYEGVRQIEVRALTKLRRVDTHYDGALAEHAEDEGFGRAVRRLPVLNDEEEGDE